MPKEKKSKEMLKTVLIFALVFIMIPATVFVVVYLVNSDFKKATNEFLRDTPGVLGEHFSKYPTESERAEKELFLADYYLSIEDESSADKLYIVKKSDEELFNNVIKRMNQKSTNKTKNIIKLVRNIELRKDLLHTLYDEIKLEQETALSEEIKRLERLELNLIIKEVEMMNARDSKEKLTKVFANMNSSIAADVLYYIEPDIKTRVLSSMDTGKRKEIDSILLQKEKRNEELIRKAKVYEAMESDRAFSEIGNTDIFKTDELSTIYMNLSISKAAEILINADNEFVNEIISKIETLEELLKEDESRSVKIIETLNFKKQYDKKIAELVMLYERMEPVDVVRIVDKMIKNNDTVTAFEIDESQIYTISDATIILDVLRNMKNQKVSQVLSNMEPSEAAIITRELAIQ
ncbi:hypothetical protein DW1_1882 [Proteiniborus sp. DW1]|uniref:hypothetical protein n=1 Tax=Proteiniborus sp. DW1 TaxID=1889883 RepID=UPI00092E1C23|nr:hypothetical protein [Proteiniborus sp. DW1]SCG83450.1 hypothetical protein DW1_1882 [Proteiniborus sp. DW1]